MTVAHVVLEGGLLLVKTAEVTFRRIANCCLVAQSGRRLHLDPAEPMTSNRPPQLQSFLDHTEAAILAAAKEGSSSRRAALTVFDRCRAGCGTEGNVVPQTLPVCEKLGAALAEGRPVPVAAVFGELSPRLSWYRRASANPQDARFWDGHANTVIFGQGGLEERRDVWIGATLMDGGVTYVDHDHPPEEVYLALSPGEWWNAEMDWTEPGPGGLIYNPPGIRHAMRSGPLPFLALWFLPL
jgi:hypothetical protein